MSFDMQKARALCDGEYRSEVTMTESGMFPGLKNVVDRANMLSAALDEIDRLQDLIDKPPEEADWDNDYALLTNAVPLGLNSIGAKWMLAFRKAQNSNLLRRQQNEGMQKEIDRLNRVLDGAEMYRQNSLKNIESLANQRDRLEALNPFNADVSIAMRVGDNEFVYGNAANLDKIENRIKSQVARIKQLEGWLVMERSDLIKLTYPNEGDKLGIIITTTQEDIDLARQQLQSEDKIGTGDHIVEPDKMVLPPVRDLQTATMQLSDRSEPTKMMLTKEQRAALEAACQIFQAAIDGERGKPLTESVIPLVGINSIIGAMLREAKQ